MDFVSPDGHLNFTHKFKKITGHKLYQSTMELYDAYIYRDLSSIYVRLTMELCIVPEIL